MLRRTVIVHIDSPEPVNLQRETGNRRDPFYDACTSPCDEAVPADGRYRIAGDSVRPSRRFTLPEGTDRDTIVVNPASRAAFDIGIVLAPAGGLAAAIGGWVLLSSAFAESPDGSSPSSGNAGRTIGLSLVGAGLVGVAVGLALAIPNGRSKVRQSGEATSEVIAPRTGALTLTPIE